VNGKESARVRLAAGLLNRSGYLLLLVTICLTAIPYGTVQPWWISIFECAIFLIAILAVAEFTITKRWQLQWTLVAPLLVLILFAIIQSIPLFSGPGPISPRTAISADPFSTRSFALELSALVSVSLLLLHYTTTKARLTRLIYVIVGIGAASALFGIIRQSLQTSPGFLLPALPTGGRSFGQFINKNHFALLVEMSLGLTLGLIMAEWDRHRRVIVLVLVAVMLWAAIIYSNSRGGIVASLCQMLFVAAFIGWMRAPAKDEKASDDENEEDDRESRWQRIRNLAGGLVTRAFLLVCLVGLLIYGVSWIGGEPVVSNLEFAVTDFSQQQMGNNVNSSRKEIWAASWQMFKAHPIAGVGFGAYWIGITRYHRASGEITPQQAHNDYLELLTSGGLIAYALLIWFAILFLRAASRRVGPPDVYCRAVSLGALAGIFGVAIHSIFDFGLHITINALVFFVLLVIVLQSNPLVSKDIDGAGTLTNGV